MEIIDLGIGVSFLPESFRLEKLPPVEYIERGMYYSVEAGMTIEVMAQEPNGDIIFHWGKNQPNAIMNLKFFKQLFVRQC